MVCEFYNKCDIVSLKKKKSFALDRIVTNKLYFMMVKHHNMN